MKRKQSEFITASELASFAFCPESWRLEYGLGLEAGNQAARQAGSRHHARKAMTERLAGGLILLARILAILAALAVLLLLWRWR